MKRYCLSCARQIVKNPPIKGNLAPLDGAKAGVGGIFCGHCAKDLDENGLFPEER